LALTFTPPKKTPAGEPLSESPAIEIYRGFAAPEFKGKTTDLRLAFSIPSAVVADYLREGHMEFADPLPPEELVSHPGKAVVYIVRTRASGKRASADSNAAVVRVYPVPAGIHDARANVTETAIELSWSAPTQIPQGASIVGYRVYRVEVNPASVADGAKEASQARLQAPLTLLASSATASYRDTQFEFGKAYLYSIRSVIMADSATLESGDSNPLWVTPKDVFPPAPPQGLVAVVVPGTPEAPPNVELSWSINSETDWAGYYVYRSDKEGAPGERLTPELLPVPTFRDISVVSGRRYFYRVTAVDRAGNESAPSTIAAAELPQPSP
jgi:hypothetical protein